MYAAMAANLHMPYWVVTASGKYDTAMTVDLPQLRRAMLSALDTVRAARAAKRTAAGATAGGSTGGGSSADAAGADGGGVGAEVVGLLKRLKRRCPGGKNGTRAAATMSYFAKAQQHASVDAV